MYPKKRAGGDLYARVTLHATARGTCFFTRLYSLQAAASAVEEKNCDTILPSSRWPAALALQLSAPTGPKQPRRHSACATVYHSRMPNNSTGFVFVAGKRVSRKYETRTEARAIKPRGCRGSLQRANEATLVLCSPARPTTMHERRRKYPAPAPTSANQRRASHLRAPQAGGASARSLRPSLRYTERERLSRQSVERRPVAWCRVLSRRCRTLASAWRGKKNYSLFVQPAGRIGVSREGAATAVIQNTHVRDHGEEAGRGWAAAAGEGGGAGESGSCRWRAGWSCPRWPGRGRRSARGA